MKQAKQIITTAVAVGFCSTALTACGGAQEKTSYDPYTKQSPYATPNPPQKSRGLSTGRKVAVLAGAAALYYLLKKNQDQREQGVAVPQYYLSKNGRVYYRDKSGGVHWVEAPATGIQVPEAEAQAYKVDGFQGYNGRNSGRGLAGLNPAMFQ